MKKNARMRLLAVLFAFCTVAPAFPASAEVAGQVLNVIGDVFALRDGRIIRLAPGGAVESGDQIHTGADSHVQIRFTDWGLIALRSRSDFIVDEYSYERGVGGRERAFFSLLRGGVRSLTGAIGHFNRANFRIRVPTSTIGIRGTHFSLLICELECRNPDGGTGEAGLYGSVLQGRIAVSPYGGPSLEREFGAGEFFVLADANSIPRPLFSLPLFFRDSLDEHARSIEGTATGVTASAPADDPIAEAISRPDATKIGGLTGTVSKASGSLTGTVTGLVGIVGGSVGNITGGLTSLTTGAVTGLVGVASGVTDGVATIAAPLSAPLVAPVITAIGALSPATVVAPVTSAISIPVAAPVLTTIGVPVNPPIALPATPAGATGGLSAGLSTLLGKR